MLKKYFFGAAAYVLAAQAVWCSSFDDRDAQQMSIRELIDRTEKDHSEYRELQTSWIGRVAGFAGALPCIGSSIVRVFGMPDIADIGEQAITSQQNVDNEHRI